MLCELATERGPPGQLDAGCHHAPPQVNYRSHMAVNSHDVPQMLKAMRPEPEGRCVWSYG